jgi:hypothetical protein
MATQEPEQDNTLSKVARSVRSALGTVASKVTDLVGEKSDTADDNTESKAADEKESKSSDKPERKPAKSASSSASSTKTGAPAKKASARTAAKGKSQQVKKIKRDKHRRKLGRKTRG